MHFFAKFEALVSSVNYHLPCSVTFWQCPEMNIQLELASRKAEADEKIASRVLAPARDRDL